eukprot:COSAG02_NODE_185_length_30442_cov_59.370168_11_plen_134_part_00
MVALVHSLLHTPLPELVSWHTLPATGSPKSVSNAATGQRDTIQSGATQLKGESLVLFFRIGSTFGLQRPDSLTVGARERVRIERFGKAAWLAVILDAHRVTVSYHAMYAKVRAEQTERAKMRALALSKENITN